VAGDACGLDPCHHVIRHGARVVITINFSGKLPRMCFESAAVGTWGSPRPTLNAVWGPRSTSAAPRRSAQLR